MRHTGIDMIGDVPWGTHFCQFYQDQQDLIDILVPYFRAGLENNEFCMWVTSEPLRAQEARDALAGEIPNLEDYLRQGQIEILDYSQWYTAGGRFESDRVLQGWVSRLEGALQRGFDGLRLTGNTFWLEKSDWRGFTEYEAAVDGVIGRYRMLALCTYSLAQCGAAEIMDVVANHAFALVKRAGQWQVIENVERKRAEASLRASEEKARHLASFPEANPQPVIEADAQGGILYANPAVSAILEKLGMEPDPRVFLPPDIGEIMNAPERSVQREVAVGDRAFAESIYVWEGFVRIYATDITGRKQAEEALRQSESRRAVAEALEAERDRLNEILDKLPVMVCLITPDYHLPFANRMFRETFGEPRGRTCYNYIFNLAQPCPQCESLVPLKTGRPHQWLNPCPGDRLIEAHDFPFTDVDGSPMILEVDLDITERKRMEEELRTASRYARSLIEASLDPLVTISPEGKITDVNQATELVSGVPREQLIGTSFSEYFTEPREAEKGYHKVLAEGLVRDYPLTIRHVSGRTTDVLYNAVLYRNEAGEVQGVFAAARDVTERKRMEEQLRSANESLQQLAAIVESSNDAITAKDLGGVIRSWNQAAERLYGYTASEALGKPIDLLVPPDRPNEVPQILGRIRRGERVEHYETVRLRKDGRRFTVSLTVSPIKDAASRIVGASTIARDVSERKRMEEEVRAASLYARSLIEASLDPLVTISPDGQITDVNEATELVTGAPRNWLIGSRFSEYFTEPHEAEEGYQKVLGEGLVRDYPLTIRHVSGRTTDVLYNASVYRNQAGEVQGVFAAARDITVRKKMEENLRAASLYARSLIEASLDPLVTISPEGRITDVNQATELVSGVPREQLIGTSFSEYFTEPREAEKGYHKVLAEGLVRDYPMTIRHVDGHTTDVLYNAVVYRNEAGEVQGVFAAARDVTERKRLEEELRVASLYARSLIEASLDPLVTISPDGQITDVNEATELVTGAPRARLIGSDFAEYFTEPDRARAGYRKVLAEGLVRDYPMTIRHVDGHTTDVLYNAVVYRNEAGEVQGVFAAARDVTERKRAEAELARYRGHLEELVQQRTGELQTANAHLRRTTAELVRSNQELEQFAYVASHDLQEPLRAVTGYLGLIEQQFGDQLDGKGRHYIAGAVQGAARMHALITDLLALSRVGTRGQAFEPADLNAVLDQALEGLGASIQETGARITRAPLPTLRVDAGQIAQLFQNLIGNALKFRGERPPEIQVSARQKPGQWVFAVRDNGIGIEPQYFERIFLIFQRLHTRHKYQGTGMGLAICKKIVERHGGAVWVESQPDQGSTFYFTIPEREIP